MEVKRKSLTNETKAFVFDYNSTKFLVKNFSETDCIYVAFNKDDLSEANLENSPMIGKGMGQVIFDNLNCRNVSTYLHNVVYVKTTGTDVVVEIQELTIE